MIIGDYTSQYRLYLVGIGWWFGTMEFYDFPYIGNDHPSWLSYFSEGLKPPTRYIMCIIIWYMELHGITMVWIWYKYGIFAHHIQEWERYTIVIYIGPGMMIHQIHPEMEMTSSERETLPTMQSRASPMLPRNRYQKRVGFRIIPDWSFMALGLPDSVENLCRDSDVGYCGVNYDKFEKLSWSHGDVTSI